MTVVSIQIVPWMAARFGWQWAFTFLAVGPLIGLYFVRRLPDDAAAAG